MGTLNATMNTLFVAILGVDRDISGSVCSCNYPIEALRLRNSCIVYERKTKDVQGCGPSNINHGLSVCPFDVCWASYHFPLLTMLLRIYS